MSNETIVIAGLYRRHHQIINEEVQEDIAGPLLLPPD